MGCFFSILQVSGLARPKFESSSGPFLCVAGSEEKAGCLSLRMGGINKEQEGKNKSNHAYVFRGKFKQGLNILFPLFAIRNINPKFTFIFRIILYESRCR